MKPQLVIHDPDDWLARQLADLAAESRWVVRLPKTAKATLGFLDPNRPTLLFTRVDPHEESGDSCKLVADANRLAPDAAIVAVSDVKLPDADRIAWTAVLFDLGCRYVLFPPLTKPVLEDVASGLMASSVQRLGSADGEDVIDLADLVED
ncbi:MAG: hypothetical protein U0791_10035 [Gemmataceae bacterium]